MSRYSEKLKDPRWQKKRLEVLEENGWCCCLCWNDAKCLHVHHGHYFPSREPWEYPNWMLYVLCESCHEKVHTRRLQVIDVASKLIERTVSRLNGEVPDFVEYLHGVLGLDLETLPEIPCADWFWWGGTQADLITPRDVLMAERDWVSTLRQKVWVDAMLHMLRTPAVRQFVTEAYFDRLKQDYHHDQRLLEQVQREAQAIVDEPGQAAVGLPAPQSQAEV